jgi:hypothetical protein
MSVQPEAGNSQLLSLHVSIVSKAQYTCSSHKYGSYHPKTWSLKDKHRQLRVIELFIIIIIIAEEAKAHPGL